MKNHYDIYNIIISVIFEILTILVAILMYAKVSPEITISIIGDLLVFCILFSIILLIYRLLVEKIESKSTPVTGRSCFRIRLSCKNLKVSKIEEEGNMVRVYVKCEKKLMREEGCPRDCIVRGILSDIIPPHETNVIVSLPGVIVPIRESEVEKVIREHRAKGKEVVIETEYDPSSRN